MLTPLPWHPCWPFYHDIHIDPFTMTAMLNLLSWQPIGPFCHVNPFIMKVIFILLHMTSMLTLLPWHADSCTITSMLTLLPWQQCWLFYHDNHVDSFTMTVMLTLLTWQSWWLCYHDSHVDPFTMTIMMTLLPWKPCWPFTMTAILSLLPWQPCWPLPWQSCYLFYHDSNPVTMKIMLTMLPCQPCWPFSMTTMLPIFDPFTNITQAISCCVKNNLRDMPFYFSIERVFSIFFSQNHFLSLFLSNDMKRCNVVFFCKKFIWVSRLSDEYYMLGFYLRSTIWGTGI